MQYDSDSNGYIDAFMVVHAGQGAKETRDPTDLWSAKWVMPGAIETGFTRSLPFQRTENSVWYVMKSDKD